MGVVSRVCRRWGQERGEGEGGGQTIPGLLPSLATAFAMTMDLQFGGRVQGAGGGRGGGREVPGLPPSLATALAMMVGMESDSTVSQ